MLLIGKFLFYSVMGVLICVLGMLVRLMVIMFIDIWFMMCVCMLLISIGVWLLF